jgi:hypothetical protein
MKMTPEERARIIRIIKEIRGDLREMRATLERVRDRLEPRASYTAESKNSAWPRSGGAPYA